MTVHGFSQLSAAEGITRLIHEKYGAFNTIICDNDRLERAKEVTDKLGADSVAYSEHKLNCRHRDNVNGIGQMCNGDETELRTKTGHNFHENVGRTQQVGGNLLLYGTAIDQYDFEFL